MVSGQGRRLRPEARPARRTRTFALAGSSLISTSGCGSDQSASSGGASVLNKEADTNARNAMEANAKKPKTPVPPQRNSLELDSWNANRMLRFVGTLIVALGLAFVLGGILLPLEYWESVFASLMLTALAAGIWYGIKLRHEPSLR